MKYYVVADTHGFYTPLRKALTDAGFFCEKEPHKLVLCGDMMDRGKEAVKMQNFMLEQLQQDKLVYVKGNHEELMLSMLYDIARHQPMLDIHKPNGTWDTALQLTGLDAKTAECFPLELVRRMQKTAYIQKLIAHSCDYFETKNYVFVHGWRPRRRDWRNASRGEWSEARWRNGMECCCFEGLKFRNKIGVCGHFHTSYGHAKINHEGSEWGRDAMFTPFYKRGIIALDACTAYSGFINCIVLED